MSRSSTARWVVLAVTLALLGGTLLPASPISAAPQTDAQSKAAKSNGAAAKRLQRQRDHMERQRQRIKNNRKRFKAQKERQRAKVKQELAKAKAQTGKVQTDQAQDDTEAQGETGSDHEDGDGDNDGTDIWSGFFPWVSSGDLSDNLPTGLGLAALGAIGALILIFGLLGTYLPSMGGKAEYEALLREIRDLEKQRDEQLAPRERYVRDGVEIGTERRREAANLTNDLNQMIQAKEEEARRKYRSVLWLGIPIYVLVGGALAVLLATNALQALLIGFAWTSIVERFGLKQEQKEKKEDPTVSELAEDARDSDHLRAELAIREAEIDDMKKAISELTEKAAKLKAG